jgi:hypothetical protein
MSFEPTKSRWSARLYADNICREAIAGQISSLNVGYVAHYSSSPLLYGLELRLDW